MRLTKFIFIFIYTTIFCSNLLATETLLFTNKQILNLLIEADFGELLSEKIHHREVGIEGRLTIEGNEVFDVTIFTRGRSRMSCDFPPLKIVFKKKQIQSTIFQGNRSLKMYTHCGSIMGDKTNRERTFREYKMYRKFRRYSKKAFESRLLNVRYIDTSNQIEETNNLAFFIESKKHFEKRTGLERAEVDKNSNRTLEKFTKIDKVQFAKIKFFNFIKGN